MRIVAPFLLVAALAATVACSSSEGATTASDAAGDAATTTHAINKSVTAEQADASADVTLVSVTESTGEKDDPPESGKFVIADMTFTGKSGEYAINALYVKLKKPNGDLVEQLDGNASAAVPPTEDLKVADLTAGQTVTGKVSFDAPLEPESTIVLTDTMGYIEAEWPLPGSTETAPHTGDGTPQRAINKSATATQSRGSADVTLVSIADSTGSTDDILAPESGNFVIVEMAFTGKSGEFHVSSLYVQLIKPNGEAMDEMDRNSSDAVPSQDEIDSVDLAPGQTVTGKVGFDAVLEPGSKIVLVDTLHKVSAEWTL